MTLFDNWLNALRVMLRKQNVSEYDLKMLQSETAVDHPQISEEKTQTQAALTIKLEQPTLSS